MSDQDQDKTEKATPYKLQEAHKRGQVSKSTDMGSVAILGAFTVALLATADDIGIALAETLRMAIPTAASIAPTKENVLPWLAWLAGPILIAVSPLIIAVSVAAVLGTLLQTGFVFSSEPLKPDFNRLNPAEGLKKFFNLRILFELFKVALKLTLVGVFLAVGAGWMLKDVLGLSWLLPTLLAQRATDLFTTVAFVLLGIFVVIALLDFGFARFDFARRMRMSRREVKDEYRRREGDPEMKSRRKQLQNEMRKRAGAVSRVREADVVIVNPTRIAVALQYRSKRMLAPEVRALGAGLLAAAIRGKAREHGIPVVRNVRVARLLYRDCKLDQPVPERCFDELAPIYRWVMSLPNSKVSLDD